MEKESVYLSDFKALEKRSGGDSFIHPIRKRALERFAELGLPTTRMEEWKYTTLKPIAEAPFRLAGGGRVTSKQLLGAPFGDLGSFKLVFVGGRYSKELSTPGDAPRGLRVASLAELLKPEDASLEPYLARYARYADHAFVALNTAFVEDGAYVHIDRGAVIEQPIYLLFVSTGEGRAVSHPRTLVVAERDSQATIIEGYIGFGRGGSFTNAVTEIVTGENSIIDHYKLQQEPLDSFHIATLQVRQDRSANFYSHSITLGGALVRNEVNVVLDGEGAECTLDGLYVGTGSAHIDNHTFIDHARPHGSSRELYKGILDDRSTGVFNGSIMVRKDAQKTDAHQSNKNLLLSQNAEINTKPQLEIYADDVKCSHGATIGQIDQESIFYLRSRGIPEVEARNLLTYGFSNDVIGRIKVEQIRTRLESALFERLSREGTMPDRAEPDGSPEAQRTRDEV